MASWTALLMATALLTANPGRCFAQDTRQTTQDHPDGALTREQWQARVETACRRSEDLIANMRTQTPPLSPASVPLEAEASDRVVNDPTLRPGDIVAADRGFFVFVGRDEEHQSSDFVSIPNGMSHDDGGGARSLCVERA